jgi:hypothetical protein
MSQEPHEDPQEPDVLLHGGGSTAPESATENGCRPSCQATHLNLPANKKIPDPFYRDNHAKLHRRRVQIHWTKY